MFDTQVLTGVVLSGSSEGESVSCVSPTSGVRQQSLAFLGSQRHHRDPDACLHVLIACVSLPWAPVSQFPLLLKAPVIKFCESLNSVVSDSLRPFGLQPTTDFSWDFSGTNTRVGHHFLLQGIFMTQGSNQHLLSPALHVNSLPAETSGKPSHQIRTHSNPLWPHHNVVTSAKTLFPNEVIQVLGVSS